MLFYNSICSESRKDSYRNGVCFLYKQHTGAWKTGTRKLKLHQGIPCGLCLRWSLELLFCSFHILLLCDQNGFPGILAEPAALPFLFLQSSFRILLAVVRIVLVAALCSFLFSSETAGADRKPFLKEFCFQLLHAKITLHPSFYPFFPTGVLLVCLSATLIPWFS